MFAIKHTVRISVVSAIIATMAVAAVPAPTPADYSATTADCSDSVWPYIEPDCLLQPEQATAGRNVRPILVGKPVVDTPRLQIAELTGSVR